MPKKHNSQNDDTIDNPKTLLFEETFQVEKEFENSLKNNTFTFCNSKKVTGCEENQTFIHCENCFRDYCEACNTFCHKNCSGIIGELKSYVVYEISSSCHCTHKFNEEEEKNNKSIRLECFYSNFLFRNFNLIGKTMFYKIKKQNKIICLFCSMLHKKKVQMEEIHYEYDFCQCQERSHCSFNAIDLCHLFDNCYEINSKEIIYNDLVLKLEKELRIYLSKYFETENAELESLIEYEVTKFSIHNLIYNGMLRYTLNDEINLMKKLIDKLIQKDYYFFNYEKINFALTYIFHFYKKYLFSKIENYEGFEFILLSFQTRMNIIENNTKFYQNLKNNNRNLGYLFLADILHLIFENLLKLKNFAVNSLYRPRSDFISFFLLYFINSLCFLEEEVELFLKIIQKFDYNKNDKEINNHIRSNIDIAYTCVQNYLIDLNFKDLNNNDGKLVKKFFYLDKPNYFEYYYKKLFEDEKFYLSMSDKIKNNIEENKGIKGEKKLDEEVEKSQENEEESEDESEELSEEVNLNKDIYNEYLYYLDCFHFYFPKKFLENKNKKFKLLKLTSSDNPDSKNNKNSVLKTQRVSNMIYLQKIAIPNFKNNIVELILDNILNDCLSNIDIKLIGNFEEFIEFLFYKLKSINNFNTKNPNYTNFKIDVSRYVNNPMRIDTKQIDLTKYGEELKYLFYQIVINHQNSSFKKISKKWNLLLFLILCNETNIQFIFTKLNILEILFMNDKFYKFSIFKNEEIQKEQDYIWKMFYLADKFFFHDSEISFIFNDFIYHNFLPGIYDYIEENINNNKKKSSINYYMIHYYIKLLLKKNNSNYYRNYFPYDFNTTISIYDPISKLSSFAFETSFNVEKYLESIQIYHHSKNSFTHDDFRNNNENIINQNSKDETFYNIFDEKDKLMNIEFSNLNNSISKEKEVNVKAFTKFMNLENIKYILFRVLSSECAITEIDLYFQILNKNFNVFREFFVKKTEYIINCPDKKKYIYKLEIVILNFIINFLTLKFYNHLSLNVVLDASITKQELITFATENKGKNLETSIDFIKRPLESKYLVFKMRCKIFDLIELYLNTIDEDLYEKSSFHQNFRLYLIHRFCILLKDLIYKSRNSLNPYELEEKLINNIVKFLSKFENGKINFDYLLSQKSIDGTDQSLIHSILNEKIKFNSVEMHEKLLTRLQNEFNNKLRFIDNNSVLENHNEENLNNISSNLLNFEYFKDFLMFDNRKHSIYSKHITLLINNIKENHINNFITDNLFEIWENFSEFLYSPNFDLVLGNLFKYIFKMLEVLNLIEKEDVNASETFDLTFSENLMKMLNFINNLLYYYQPYMEFCLVNLDEEVFLKFLKIVIKLNNYIIGISDFVDNSTLFSLSQRYFIFIDFFVLVCEDKNSKNFIKLFFTNFDHSDNETDIDLNNNFYYQSFSQLANIFNLINVKKTEEFSLGSFRLIIQFLYLARFLKEFLEDDIPDLDDKMEIINNCFDNIYDFNWIISENIKNNEYSYTLRFELLNLAIAYLEEHNHNYTEDLSTKNNEIFKSHELIFKEIKICIEKAIEDLVKRNEDKKTKLNEISFQKLKAEYLADEDSLYKNKYFELAELYYKLLRLLDYPFDSLKEEYSEFNNSSSNEPEEELNKIYFDFLILIGHEIEVKFLDKTGKFKLRKIYFFKSPKCFWLNETFKNNFLEEAPRNSIGEKLDFFNKNLDLMLLEINISYKEKPNFSNLFNETVIPFLLINLDIINFILVLSINLFLLLFAFIDTSYSSVVDLNSQIFEYKVSEDIKLKNQYTIYFTIIISIIQTILLTIWYYIYYRIKLMKTAFKRIYNEKYLFEDYCNKIYFNLNSFKSYDVMNYNFNNTENNNDYINLKSNEKISKFKVFWVRLKIFLWNKEIKYVMFSLLCHLLFLMTNYHLLLVLPIFSIVRLYPLFSYFLKAILSKYKEFIALLIFIYVVEYIFSWITFLHLQEFMVNEFKMRTGNLNEVIINFY